MDEKEATIVKFPLSKIAKSQMETHAINVRNLNTDENKMIENYFPKILRGGIYNGQTYWIEKLFIGVDATKYWWKPEWNKKVADAGTTFLISLHKSTRKDTYMSASIFNSLVDTHVNTIEIALKRCALQLDFKPIVAALWRNLEDKTIPLVRTHGDFWPGNIIVLNDASISGVLDWDSSVEEGWPMLDVLHLLASMNKWKIFKHFGTVVLEKLMQKRLKSWEWTLVRKYTDQFSIKEDLWTSFVALYWLECLSYRIQSNSDSHNTNCSEAWLFRNIIEVSPSILKYLTI